MIVTICREGLSTGNGNSISSRWLSLIGLKEAGQGPGMSSEDISDVARKLYIFDRPKRRFGDGCGDSSDYNWSVFRRIVGARAQGNLGNWIQRRNGFQRGAQASSSPPSLSRG
jgi:hypothetical protein